MNFVVYFMVIANRGNRMDKTQELRKEFRKNFTLTDSAKKQLDDLIHHAKMFTKQESPDIQHFAESLFGGKQDEQ